MKKCIVLILLLIGYQSILMAQKLKSDKTAPKEDIRVNREYDENGNLIKYDSIYSYSWSGDSTLLNAISPENFPKIFDEHFEIFPDSLFSGKSFFDGFDQSFFSPFKSESDSAMRHFFNFQFKNDSTSSNLMDIDEFFSQFNKNNQDSILRDQFGNAPIFAHPKTMDELMELLNKQMKALEKHQKKFFKEQPELQEF